MLLLFKTRIVSSFQLRYLQTLNSISAEHNSTVGDDKKKRLSDCHQVIFPIPIDIISNMMTKKRSEGADGEAGRYARENVSMS